MEQSTRKVTFTVTLDMPDSSLKDLQEYIKDAVISWGGGFEPEDPFFALHENNVEVRRYPLKIKK